MPLDPTRLPRLLAGPILRRVETELVTVFVATSVPCRVRVQLFLGGDIEGPATPGPDLRAGWVSDGTPSLSIGQRVHVAVATLDLRTPGGNATRSAGPLRPDTVHSYDLVLEWEDGTSDNLRTVGLLAGEFPLGYDPQELPSFVTCPAEREKLVIVHGSCRDLFASAPLADDPAEDREFPPPGGWPNREPALDEPPSDAEEPFPGESYPALPRKDGLLWVDALIDQRGPVPRFAGRPHQLFLTGDQIYADSASTAVLPALNHVGRVLVGEEALPADVQGTATHPADLAHFPPGFRRPIAQQRAGFTMSGGESHLLSRGEFVACYLMTWSPVLWALDPFPADDDFVDLQQPAEFVEGSADEAPDAFFDRLVAHYRRKYFSREKFEWWFARFVSGLGRVRRALANVPTYMILDDHEVTDDLYESARWRDRVFTRPFGVAVVRNALTSYVAFQAWGNDPRRFASGPERRLLELLASGGDVEEIHLLLGLPSTLAPSPPTFRPQIELSYQVDSPCHRVFVLDGRTRRRFATRAGTGGGLDYEGPSGLFGDSPMAAMLPEPQRDDDRLIVVVAPVPVLGPDGAEQLLLPVQKRARVLSDVDAELWAYEPSTLEALLWALARYRSVVVLSGDIHLGYSIGLDYWSAPPGEEVRTARIVQLVSSGLTKDWGQYAPALANHALADEIFESATTSIDPAERIGFGAPVRTTPAPSPSFATAVDTGSQVAHPFYRQRLKMRAPVLPTRGWPEGSSEAVTPHWAWRMSMLRDARPETTLPPTVHQRYTPVLLPQSADPAASFGWHGDTLRRMAFGRTFAIERNLGVVTFALREEEWFVRHVLAGELPPLPGTGATPEGLHPYVLHETKLDPVPVESWAADRPRIVADGAWAVDTTEPLIGPLLKYLPFVWRWIAKFSVGAWDHLPAVLDDLARRVAVNEAADRVSAPSRRMLLRELGPFVGADDAALDAIDVGAMAAHARELGPFDPQFEARMLLLEDVERLFDLHRASGDAAAFFDDALLLASSELVHGSLSTVATVAGLLAALRAPITRRPKVLADLLYGLWDQWRNHTWTEVYVGVGQLIPGAILRPLFFAGDLLLDVIRLPEQRDLPEDDPAFERVLTVELVLAALGIVARAKLPRRLSFVSGYELGDVPVDPGTPRTERTPLTLARQTLTVLLHPGDQARYVEPVQRLTVTLIPPEEGGDVGELFVGVTGAVRLEDEIGGGWIQRVETTGGAWFRQPWAARRGAIGPGSSKLTLSFLRPTTWDLPGIAVSFTPKAELSIGVVADADGIAPDFEIAFGLNDAEDRVRLAPQATRGVLAQLLPSDGFSLPLDLGVAWSQRTGWRFRGLADGPRKALETRAPPESPRGGPIAEIPARKLGRFAVHGGVWDWGVRDEPELGACAVYLKASAAISVDFGPFSLGVTGLGLEIGVRVADDPDQSENPVDFYSTHPPATGISVAFDAKGVSGGGFLERIDGPGDLETWRGGLALAFAGGSSLAAFAVIETGGAHWSLVTVLQGRLDPPWNLPWGLKLTAIGGVLALHRGMDPQAIRLAAQGVSGDIDALLFPDRPAERFLELMPMVDRFFPRAAGRHVGGLMIEVRWGKVDAPTGQLRAALLVEIGQFKLAMFGVLRLGTPTLAHDRVARIRASFDAVYDRADASLLLSATLLESRALGTLQLTGGAAALFRGGDDPALAITLGGFHPRFRPYIPEGLREPPRLEFPWHPFSGLEARLQLYFAITGESIQAGGSAHVTLGTDWGGIRGELALDFMVLVHPETLLDVDFRGRVTIWLFGIDLFSAGIALHATGPDPWDFEGEVYWEVCGIDNSKHFGPYNGGTPEALTGDASARTILGDALREPGAWSVVRGELPVALRAGTGDALAPTDALVVRQSELPLGVPLEVRDRQRLTDPGTWELTDRGGALAKVGDVTGTFAVRRYRNETPKERPFEGGLRTGARLAGGGFRVDPSHVVADDWGAVEPFVVDTVPSPAPPRRWQVADLLLVHAVTVAAPVRAPRRAWVRDGVSLVERP